MGPLLQQSDQVLESMRKFSLEALEYACDKIPGLEQILSNYTDIYNSGLSDHVDNMGYAILAAGAFVAARGVYKLAKENI